MATVTSTWWTPLPKGMTDPFFQAWKQNIHHGGWCHASDPTSHWFCSRTPGHPGLHAAANTGGGLCCATWGIVDPAEVLPNGF